MVISFDAIMQAMERVKSKPMRQTEILVSPTTYRMMQLVLENTPRSRAELEAMRIVRLKEMIKRRIKTDYARRELPL